jgi:hypothetical protein
MRAAVRRALVIRLNFLLAEQADGAVSIKCLLYADCFADFITSMLFD